MLLNHSESPIAGLNNSIVDGLINERLKVAFLITIARITAICQQRAGGPLPIIIHGYDYPVPDGRVFLGGWWLLPGPWLEPGFRGKGFAELSIRMKHMKELIDRFNVMLDTIASLPQFNHVHFIDLRGTLSGETREDDYKRDWANELHPNEEGFTKITKRFSEVIEGLPR